MNMPPKRDTDEARRETEKTAKIQVRGLTGVVDLPKNIIYAELRSRIERGIFMPGEQVPSIADIMAMTEPPVAKNTARAALDRLRDESFIKTLTGYGSFVLPKEQWGKSPDEQ
jgi:DNA-binding FadR family transcriptional regulator